MSGSQKKATNDQLARAYIECGSVWKVAKRFGMCGQSVHERLSRMRQIKPMNVFTKADEELLLREYLIYREAGKLEVLAERMGRTKAFICRKAGKLKLTDQQGPKHWGRIWKGMSKEVAEGLFGQFKRSPMGLGQYCKHKGYDDLGFARTMKGHFPDEWEHVIELKVPKQSLYRLGRALEYRVRDELKGLGYYAVRSPASRSPVDITAFKAGMFLMVQCKRGGCVSPAEWNELLGLATSVGAVAVVASSEFRKTVYKRITGRKDGSKHRQPWEDFAP